MAKLLAWILFAVGLPACARDRANDQPSVQCPVLHGIEHVSGTMGYPAEALPTGPCANEPRCYLSISQVCTCHTTGALDSYWCSCGGGSWSCTREVQGMGGCNCPEDAGGGDGTVPAGEACNDGTGSSDCCPSGVTPGTACPTDGFACYDRCSFPDGAAHEGTRGAYSCAGGLWSAGHGLFPCLRQ
jgi:hypothetical protein